MSSTFSRKTLLLLIALVGPGVCLTQPGAADYSKARIVAKEKPAGEKSDSEQARQQSADKAVSDDRSTTKQEIKIEEDAAYPAPTASDSSGSASEAKAKLNLSPPPTPDIVNDAAPAVPPSAPRAPQLSAESGRPGVIDVFLMLEYRREEMKFTGEPTPTFVFPNPVPPFSVPDAPIHFVPGAFEPNNEQLIGYVSARVKDYGFERLRFNTQVSFRYFGDLDGTTDESPFLNGLNTFRGRRILEPLSFYTDMSGFFSDDRLTNFNLRVGRQFINGAQSVLLDGATFSLNHRRFDLDVFGGRRVSFYSDPEDRGVIGQNFLFRATPRTTFRYDLLHYADTSHHFQVRHGLGESMILDGNFFMVDDHPIDLSVGAHYLPSDGKTRLIVNFLQKLTSDDFIYDYTYRVFAKNPENQVRRRFFPLPPPSTPFHGNERLNLFDINPYTQAYVDVYRNLTQKIGVGGTAWVRYVNDAEDRGPFDNSFQEFRANADYFPSSAFELSGEYRFRNVTREDPEQARRFDDIRREGETKFHEIYANTAYHFPNNRLTLEGGLFYRRFDTQSRLISLDGLDTIGFTAGVKWRITRNYKLLLEYGIDD